jgi:hypothetical protein
MLHNIVTSSKMFVLVRLYKNMTCRFVFLRRQTDLRHAANRRHAVRGESRCRRARMGCKGAGVPTASSTIAHRKRERARAQGWKSIEVWWYDKHCSCIVSVSSMSKRCHAHGKRRGAVAGARLKTFFWAVPTVLVWVLMLLGLPLGINAVSQDTLYVHIIPHSHCDPGWLDTFEGYFRHDVNRILTNVLAQLWDNPDRRFVWAELSFFTRWWKDQPTDVKKRFKEVVQRGQLEFVGGGWVQNDEANPTMESVVNQVTTGHEFLLKTFGVRPKIGWQIDPFGHSAMTPALFANLGYDATVINRIHFQQKSKFKATRHMEFLWEGAKLSNEEDLDLKIFTHVLHTHYSAPRGFDFENPGVSPVSGYNANGRARDFINQMRQRQRAYRTNHILVPFGDDFKFKQAARQFSSMGNVIQAVNSQKNMNVHVRYSTLSEYFQAVYAEATQKKINFPVYKLDFFPYADNGDSYWSGYYTTRPTLKAATRTADKTLRAVEAAYAMGRAILRADEYAWEAKFAAVQQLREEASLVLHHDAITGTSRATVVSDYLRRLTQSSAGAMGVAADVWGRLLAKPGSSPPKLTSAQYRLSFDGTGIPNDGTNGPLDAQGYPVIVQNPLGWSRNDVVKVILSDRTSMHTAQGLVVMDHVGVPVRAQVHTVFHGENMANGANPSHAFVVHFEVTVPPLGARTYYVRRASKAEKLANDGTVAAFVRTKLYVVNTQTGKIESPQAGSRLRGATTEGARLEEAVDRPLIFPDEGISIQNGEVRVQFIPRQGLVQSVTRLKDQDVGTVTAEQEFMYFSSSRSGAYIFRPHGMPKRIQTARHVAVAVADGPLVSQVQHFDDLMRQTTRVLQISGELSKVVEMLTSATASMNSEVITRFTTNLETKNTFFTDNSVDWRERHTTGGPIAGKFFPMNTMAALKQGSKQLTWINRQPMGASSLEHGPGKASLEIMLHRCLSQDDGRGLAQGVHDSTRTAAPIWLLVSSPAEADDSRVRLRHHLQHSLMVFQGQANGVPIALQDFSAVHSGHFAPVDPLDKNVHILSFKVRDAHSDDVLLRVQNLGGSSKPFPLVTRQIAFQEVRARSASANQPFSAVRSRLHYPTEGEVHDHSNVVVGEEHKDENQNTEEEGVFLSDAAMAVLAKDKEKAKGGGRRLLSGGKALIIKPWQLKTYLVEVAASGVVSLPDTGAAKGSPPIPPLHTKSDPIHEKSDPHEHPIADKQASSVQAAPPQPTAVGHPTHKSAKVAHGGELDAKGETIHKQFQEFARTGKLDGRTRHGGVLNPGHAYDTVYVSNPNWLVAVVCCSLALALCYVRTKCGGQGKGKRGKNYPLRKRA